MHWARWFGLDANGPVYAFASGPGPFLEGLGIAGVLVHHLNCHEPGCWRPARHHMGGYCRRHRKAPDGAG